MGRNGTTTLERAFDLVRSGDCEGAADIRRLLTEEGYADVAGELYGRSIGMQLTEVWQAAKKAKTLSPSY